jgi:hypothetical protein
MDDVVIKSGRDDVIAVTELLCLYAEALGCVTSGRHWPKICYGALYGRVATHPVGPLELQVADSLRDGYKANPEDRKAREDIANPNCPSGQPMRSALMPYHSTRYRWQETHQSEPPSEPFLANLENGPVLNWHQLSLPRNCVDHLTWLDRAGSVPAPTAHAPETSWPWLIAIG